MKTALYPALQKFWRHKSGLSQLNLALEAAVSARHISFLETGRSAPSREMVLRIAACLAVPMRQTNEMLEAAGHARAFQEPEAMSIELKNAMRQLMEQPFPIIVFDRLYDVVELNATAGSLAQVMTPGKPVKSLNAMRALFDPDQWQPYILNFDEVARDLLSRLQREALASHADKPLQELLADIEAYPTVDSQWRQPDLSRASEPALVVRLSVGSMELSMISLITAFSAPQNVTLQELRIESYFPFDETTRKVFASLSERQGPY